jgi:integrase
MMISQSFSTVFSSMNKAIEFIRSYRSDRFLIFAIHFRAVIKTLESLPRGLHTDRIFLMEGKAFEDFKKSYRKDCKEAEIKDFTFHDLRHCALNNLRLAGNDYFKIMAVSGHKTMACFKRCNLVTEKELSAIRWTPEQEKTPPIATNMDTNEKGVTENIA